ncbi:MAG: chromosome segregation protein SMC [Gemmataceae bacterium]|nr:chromosome segregation protein SMC [Gemmataceae bacterium]
MLKRLELIGFKSFAEKTAFDFGDGITAIIGPNGSGKSNIIDSVRWALGEQSAKSLRGGEMVDVIFNGSTSRRSLGLAEVTMTFDNRRKVLASQAEEIQVTRRVYRDGQGEYLINQQPCRLKDVKELFLGSGAGGGAYCIIEQGRVDVLLQASNQERRSIFEEAAGISRFKAKKTETLRKLERVEQNLQRLQDIIDEVEKQLRSVKLQAAKAQRYQEYSGRLRELRVGLGLQEYHQLTERLTAETEVLERLRAALKERAEQAAEWEADMQQLEGMLNQLDDRLREQEALLSAARERIRAEETTLAHENALSTDLEAELARTRGRLTELNGRVAALAESARRAREELHGVEAQREEQREGVRALEEGLQATIWRLAELNQRRETDKNEHMEQMRRSALLQNDAVSYKAQIDNLRRERDRLRLRTEQAAESLASLDVELQELGEADAELQGRLGTAREELAQRRAERERLGQLRDETGELLSDLRQQRSGLSSRVEVLEGLERSHEGLGTGVREVFGLLERPDPGPWRTVVGMIADLLTVRREYAHLIDLALGDWAQRFLVRDLDALAEALAQRGQPFSGRVTFLPLRPPTNGAQGDGRRPNRVIEVSLVGQARAPRAAEAAPAHAGVIAPAEALVSCDHPELSDLPGQLLGRTLIVLDLATARALAPSTPGYRLVTLQGELLEPDGTLTVGMHHAETGILSRKSELRELRGQLASLDRRIGETERDLADLRERLADLEERMAAQERTIQVLAEQVADLRARLERHRDRRQGLHEEVAVSRDEIQRVEQEIGTLEQAWQGALEQVAAAEERVHALAARMHEADVESRAREEERQARQQEYTLAKVALAKVEERLQGLRAQHDQREADLSQRQQERDECERGLQTSRSRLVESQRTMLQASAVLAQGYLDKEAAERRVAELSADRATHRQERVRLASLAQTVRAEWRDQQEQAHTRELEVNDLKHHRETLCDRLREDYQVELGELYREQGTEDRARSVSKGQDQTLAYASGSVLSPEQANEEIAELRRKLSRLGSVNLDSLQELSELETRARSLQEQHDDLTSAKRSLEEIIGKINQDSKRLFSETFVTIRTHFQELFRKLFGGGMADVILEDENDILECGIEINARPPGKELRSISLMSGGEKTLTAVALLLAIFRSKPSPFCILDEVDAALDEANIGRFTGVLREFLDRSQFIIITHSKRTMTCADVLYGITMQESGVSKRVAVRFEDWPEDNGQPRETAEQGVA